MDEIPDTRFFPFVVYHQRFLLWYGLAIFLCKLGSRRQADYDLRDLESQVLPNLNRLAGTQQDSLPVHKTLDHFLSHVGTAPLAALRTRFVRRLLRMRALDDSRLEGHFVVVLDGTGHVRFHRRHCPHCLTQKHEETTVYFHKLLEAKLVTPSGLALSIGTEFVENPDPPATARAGPAEASGGEEARKQDCELKAFSRLAPVLKGELPQTRLCLTGDSIFACGRGLQAAKDNGWAFFFTFKPTHMPAVWADFQGLLTLCPENVLRVHVPPNVTQVYRWVNGLSYQDDEKRTHVFNAIQCEETVASSAPTGQPLTTTFAWITGFPVTAQNVARLATKGGRIRCTIENQGFNIQKNSGLNLEHAYSFDSERLKAYYYLMQIAHMILQLVEQGSLLRHLAQRLGKSPLQLFGSLQNIARRLLECFRNRFLPDEAFDLSAAAAIQIRLDSS